MINCTKHSLERYAERFKNVDKKSINRDLYTEELNKMYDNSELVFTGKFNDNEITNFRIADNIILVTDVADTKIITLYKIEFGFGRETDLIIQKSLLEKLKEKDIEYQEALKENEENKIKLNTEKDNLKLDIESLERSLKIMNGSLKSLEEYIKGKNYKEITTKNERDVIAKKIVYSNIYRKALEEYSK